MADLIHYVEHFDPEPYVSVVVAECGASASIGPDGTVSPVGFDFYGPPYWSKVTCPRCIVASADTTARSRAEPSNA